MKDNLTEEQIVEKFFFNISIIPEKKDYFLRDFDEYYFRIRPKYTSKLIRIFLEVTLSLYPLYRVITRMEFQGSYI